MRLWRRRSWLLKKTEIAWVRTGKYLRLKSKRLGFTCWIQAPGPHELNDLRSEFALHRRTKHQYFFSIPIGPLTWARTPPAPRRRPVWCSARATPWSSQSQGWRWCTPPTGRCWSPYWQTRGKQWSGRYWSSQSEHWAEYIYKYFMLKTFSCFLPMYLWYVPYCLLRTEANHEKLFSKQIECIRGKVYFVSNNFAFHLFPRSLKPLTDDIARSCIKDWPDDTDRGWRRKR